jgi:hypothetical protein
MKTGGVAFLSSATTTLLSSLHLTHLIFVIIAFDCHHLCWWDDNRLLLRDRLECSISTVLNSAAVDTRCWSRHNTTCASFTTALVVLVDDVKGVNVSWKVSKHSEEDVDEEISSTSSDESDTNRWDYTQLVVVDTDSQQYLRKMVMMISKIELTMLSDSSQS